MEKIMYSLAHKETGELIKYDEHSNDGQDFCNSTTVELSKDGSADWLVEKLASVHWVKYGRSTPWYNSDIDNPTVGYYVEIDEYEPVKVVVTTERLAVVPDFICLDEDELINAIDYDKRSGIIAQHPHRYLVVWLVQDSAKYKDKVGIKIKTSSYAYRILVWAGEYQGRSALIVSDEKYE